MTTVSRLLLATKVLCNALEVLVRVPDKEELARYLFAHPDIAALVPSVAKTTREVFPDAELSLEVYHDPENYDVHLALYVRVANYSCDTMDRIEGIWETYSSEDFGDGWLLVTTDFAPPRGIDNARPKDI